MELDSLVPSLKIGYAFLLYEAIENTNIGRLTRKETKKNNNSIDDNAKWTRLLRLFYYNKYITPKNSIFNYINRLAEIFSKPRFDIDADLLTRLAESFKKTEIIDASKQAKIDYFLDIVSHAGVHLYTNYVDRPEMYDIISKIQFRIDILDKDFPAKELVKARWYTVTGQYKIGL